MSSYESQSQQQLLRQSGLVRSGLDKILSLEETPLSTVYIVFLQRQFASERIGAILEDRRIREQDEMRHRTNFQQQIEAKAQKIRKLEELLGNTTKDYILGW